MKRNLFILVVIAFVLIGGILFVKNQNIGSEFIWKLSNGGEWLLPLVVAGALIDSINPCAFSVLILTIAFLFSLGRLRSDIIKLGVFYIAGLFLVYILIGLGILNALHLFNTPNFMGKVGATLLIVLGAIILLQIIFPNFPIKLKIPKISHYPIAKLMERASAPASFLLGGLVGLCEFPCTGGPYLMVLGLLHDNVTRLKGLGYLVFYNLVFVLPLVIILSISSNKVLLDKIDAWRKENNRILKWASGLLMVALGAIILLFI